MTTSLDSILSGQVESAPAPETTPSESSTGAQTTQVTQTEGGEQSPAETGQSTEATEGGKTVPIEALHAERQKAKRYTEQVASFEQTLKDRETAWERRFSQLLERVAPPQPQQEKPDFFANPDDAVQAALRAAINPVVQHISQMSESVSRRFAVQEHGTEPVTAAYAEMEKRLASDPAAPGEYNRIMRSGDPWGELVKWHKRESALAEFGNDPTAYRDKLKAELLAELKGNGGGAQQEQQQPAPVMPSNLAGARNVGNRTGPAWAGPTPLNDIFKR